MKNFESIKSIWQEGRYYDAWMFVHFLAGVVIGLGALILNIQILAAYISTVILLVLWEVFEVIEDIREHKENRAGDVVIGLLGFILSFSFLPLFLNNFWVPFISCSFIFLVSSVVGWTRYFKYKRLD
jgi:CHASE2 domain-containing sensor protein